MHICIYKHKVKFGIYLQSAIYWSFGDVIIIANFYDGLWDVSSTILSAYIHTHIYPHKIPKG